MRVMQVIMCRTMSICRELLQPGANVADAAAGATASDAPHFQPRPLRGWRGLVVLIRPPSSHSLMRYRGRVLASAGRVQGEQGGSKGRDRPFVQLAALMAALCWQATNSPTTPVLRRAQHSGGKRAQLKCPRDAFLSPATHQQNHSERGCKASWSYPSLRSSILATIGGAAAIPGTDPPATHNSSTPRRPVAHTGQDERSGQQVQHPQPSSEADSSGDQGAAAVGVERAHRGGAGGARSSCAAICQRGCRCCGRPGRSRARTRRCRTTYSSGTLSSGAPPTASSR